MNIILSICFVSLCIVSINSDTSETTQRKKKPGPGPAGCGYFGSLDISCNKSVVPCDVLPEQCTSFFYDGLMVDISYHVQHYYSKEDEVHYDELLKCGCNKPVYVYYGYAVEQFWTQVLGCNGCSGQNAMDEMVGLQAYMMEHPGAAGFVLCGLEFNDITKDPFPNFTENLSTYIKVMQSTFSDMEVAISISGKFLIDQFTKPQTRQWLDLKVISELLDFVVITLTCFNSCTEELKCGGVVPLSGNANYTLEKLKCVLDNQGISKEKLHFLYPTTPSAPETSDASFCDLTYTQVCTNKSGTTDWCTDNSDSFIIKGQFAQENGGGFIIAGIDLDYNTKDCCCCKDMYPTFEFLLDGFNNVPADTCSLLDTR